MQKFLVTASLTILIGLSGNSQSRSADNNHPGTKTIINFFQALADRDTVNLKKYVTSDFLLLEGGEIWNMDTLATKVGQNKSSDYKRINSFDFIDIRARGKVTWVSYKNQAQISRNGKSGTLRWLETAVLLKVKRVWKIQTLHSTAMK